MTTTTRRLARNAASLTVGNSAVRILTAAATVVTARFLGPTEYGILGSAIGFTAVAAFMTDLGSGHLMVREGTRPNTSIEDVLYTGALLRVGLALSTTIVSLAFAFLAYPSGPLRETILIVSIPTIWAMSAQDFASGYFAIRQDMHLVALTRLVTGVTQTAALLVGVALAWPVTAIGAAYGLSASAGAVTALGIMLRRQPIRGGWLPRQLAGWAGFILGGMLTVLLPQLGALVLPKATTLEATGVFLAAYKIPLVLYTIPGSIAGAFFPQLFILGQSDATSHRELCKTEITLMTTLGLALSLPLALAGRWAIVTLFGRDWPTSAIDSLIILAPVVLLQSINFALGDSMTTANRQSRRALGTAVAVILGVALYAVLGSHYGAQGAALAAVAVELLLTSALIVLNPLGGTLFRAAAMTVLRSILTLLPLALLIALGWLPQLLGALVAPVVVGCALLTDARTRHSARRVLSKMRGSLWKRA